MQIVVDANPIISILIKPGKPIELLFREELELFAPSLLLEEIKRTLKNRSNATLFSKFSKRILPKI